MLRRGAHPPPRTADPDGVRCPRDARRAGRLEAAGVEHAVRSSTQAGRVALDTLKTLAQTAALLLLDLPGPAGIRRAAQAPAQPRLRPGPEPARGDHGGCRGVLCGPLFALRPCRCASSTAASRSARRALPRLLDNAVRGVMQTPSARSPRGSGRGRPAAGVLPAGLPDQQLTERTPRATPEKALDADLDTWMRS